MILDPLEALLDDKLLTPHEAAERLRVSAGTMRNWRSDHTGPPWVVVGGLVRYRSSEIEAYLRARTVDPKVAHA